MPDKRLPDNLTIHEKQGHVPRGLPWEPESSYNEHMGSPVVAALGSDVRSAYQDMRRRRGLPGYYPNSQDATVASVQDYMRPAAPGLPRGR